MPLSAVSARTVLPDTTWTLALLLGSLRITSLFVVEVISTFRIVGEAMPLAMALSK